MVTTTYARKYIAAANRYRRRFITFATEMEGLIPTYGDLIAITHDMPSWGISGEIVGFDSASETMTASVPLPWEGGGLSIIWKFNSRMD